MAPAIPPTRRSRNGCIDCRRAKVKCDEIRPSCGTCARRRHVCQGYKTPAPTHSRSSNASLPLSTDSSGVGSGGSGGKSAVGAAAASPKTPASEASVTETIAVATTPAEAECRPTLVVESPRIFSLIPPGTVPLGDQPHFEVYFNRHPFELLIGQEFVCEMNANVLMMLQQDPVTVADAVSALVTLAQPGHQATIPTVLSNVASLITHHVSAGGNVSSIARYYLRALARQDLVVSLVQLRRPKVPTYVWLEDEPKPDRLLGYTVTMMPLLEELCTLAEEVRDQVLQPAFTNSLLDGSGTIPTSDDTSPPSLCLDSWLDAGCSDTLLRADSLRMRLEAWRPMISDSLSFRSSRKFRAQAACYRAGALLYLHRLFNLPNSSPTADAEALSKAHDVMLYTSGPPAETKMLLWPVFLAACEMLDDEDRTAVRDVFDSIGTHRKTVTVERTRTFVEERVWKARDAGQDWNWMVLAQLYPGECLPI
ncbi:hypothetical protein K4K51_000488 [Colletotrichum sp. SAR 10_75]|nr:hypothetical protein K4K51_000488 [Colletotrichum sp. SAR 10_75]